MINNKNLKQGGMGGNMQLFHGDCLEVMDQLIEQNIKVDAIICDPPY
jgi:DNA modification methylase